MKINLKKFDSIEQAYQSLGIQSVKQISQKQMSEVIQQCLFWAKNNEAKFKYWDDNVGITFLIQHGVLKENWQNLPQDQMLKEQVCPEICDIAFLNCNGFFVVLTAGFVDPSRNFIWKLGSINGETIKMILLA